MSKKKGINIDSLTKKQIKSELNREKYKSKYSHVLKTTIYTLVILAAFAAIIATLVLPVLQISGDSMDPTYNNGDIVATIKTNRLNQGDIIAFYHGNKILVKRVIATEGSWVNMDDKGNVTVNGIKIEEEYVINKQIGDYSIKFPYQVPTNSVFVLSDDRSNMIDSRSIDVGSISKDDLIGKVLFKVWPLN